MKNGSKISALAAALTISLTIGLTACGSNDNENTKKTAAVSASISASNTAASSDSTTTQTASNEKFKFGKLKIQALGGGACGAPSYVAFEKGFFAEEGLDAELVSGTLDELKTGLVTGEFTVTNGDFQYFPSIQQGMDLKIIGGLHKGCIRLVVPPNSTIKTAKDLKGKKIGVDEIGGTPMSVATIVLANAGIDPQTEVTWVPFPLDQLTQAVKKGEVDAFAAWDPFGVIAEKNEGYTALSDISTDPLFAGKSCCFLYGSKKQIDENPERVAAIARAYKKATEWIKANPEETAKLEIEKKYVATDDIKLLTELIKSYDYEYTTTNAYDDIKYFVEQFNKTGFLKKGTDPKGFADQVYFDILNR
ncbi:MAG TPA: ABC transporter substrate-binding protein [Ruminiclostridium sp.]|nr:ABC transporter substrate-binding protein [Ruminiclostridium sp.]